MILRSLRALVVLIASALAVQGAFAQAQPPAQARFAFVVGNDSYEGAELPTAANDAALVAEMLKSAGFDVTGARNLDQETLRASYREFLEKVGAAGPEAVAFVYVSGYGLQADGENYFIPPGSRIARAADLTLNGVRLTDITRSLGGLPAQARIMVFDLAYAGPFAREGQAPAPGLAIMDAGPGDLIAFNASPGAVAPNGQPPYGAFAQALAEMARVAGTPVADVFDHARVRVAEMTKGAQVPWSASRLETPVVLFARGADAPPPAISQADIEARRARPLRDVSEAEAYALALDRDNIRGYEEFLAAYPSSPYARNVRNIVAARREAVTWRRTVQVNTAQAYWSYLDRYPKGPNAPAARARLARLQAALDPPPSYEAVEYDVAPPPVEENTYFVEDGPRYFEVVEAPVEVVYIAPRPVWWRPPPPPIYVEDSHYFLPMPVPVVTHPVWVAPPVYVVPPPQPIVVLPHSPGVFANPYVAVPTALAAGIAAGSIVYRRDRLAQPGVGPGRPFLPPVVAPPRGRPQTLPAALQPQNLQNFQQRPRPINNQLQQQGGQQLRPGQQLPNALPNAIPGQPGVRPGVGQQGLVPGVQQPGVQGRPLSPQERQRQLQQERQQQLQMQRQQQMQQQQQRQQQLQNQRQQQMQLQQQRQQQLRDQQQQRQLQMQNQRQQQMQQQQQRQQQLRDQQLQRREQLQQRQGRPEVQQQQQRDRQMQIQQQRQQQLQMQNQRQQQLQMQNQRQQQCRCRTVSSRCTAAASAADADAAAAPAADADAAAASAADAAATATPAANPADAAATPAADAAATAAAATAAQQSELRPPGPASLPLNAQRAQTKEGRRAAPAFFISSDRCAQSSMRAIRLDVSQRPPPIFCTCE